MRLPRSLEVWIESRRPHLHGWCTAEKAALLAKHVLEARAQLCVEIGVFGGASLLPQAMTLHHLAATGTRAGGMIVGIDPWSRTAALEHIEGASHVDWTNGVDFDVIRSSCMAAIAAEGLSPHVRLLRSRAEDAVEEISFPIDVLHIDGNHSEAKSVADVTLYLPKVRPGGVIFFDDVSRTDGHPPRPTTARAVAMLVEACERIDHVNDCAVFRKRLIPSWISA